jgi:hypothetical protein
LLSSLFFAGTTDAAALTDKQAVFLVVAGAKPVAEAASGHWLTTASGRAVVADDPKAVANFLKSLGLAYQISGDGQATVAAVALRPDLVQAYLDARGDFAIGQLLGYPETAIAAYAQGDCLTIPEQEAAQQTAGMPPDFLPFRFSRDHWQEELLVATDWFELLRTYGLTTRGPAPAQIVESIAA